MQKNKETIIKDKNKQVETKHKNSGEARTGHHAMLSSSQTVVIPHSCVCRRVATV